MSRFLSNVESRSMNINDMHETEGLFGENQRER
jgi:hypothetical protein